MHNSPLTASLVQETEWTTAAADNTQYNESNDDAEHNTKDHRNSEGKKGKHWIRIHNSIIISHWEILNYRLVYFYVLYREMY